MADVNGDGLPDVLLTTDRETPGPSEGQRLRLFLNQGNRKFKEAKDAFSWNQGQWDKQPNILPIHVFLRDINDDGFPDIIVSDISPILKEKPVPYFLALNDGHGHFTPLDPASMGPPFLGSHLWPADVMGKGRPDLVGLHGFGDWAGKQYLSKGVDIVTYENIPNGGVKIPLTSTTEDYSGSHGHWVNSNLLTTIKGARKGQDKVDFNVRGDFGYDGDFSNLQIVINAPVGKKVPQGLAKCIGPAPVSYGDGQYRIVFALEKQGNAWVAQDLACHMKNATSVDAFMMKYVTTSFRGIATDMVTTGSIGTVKSAVFQGWLKKVASGDIVVR